MVILCKKNPNSGKGNTTVKLFQRILALLLCLATLTGLLAGCTGAAEDSDYATKGEFFYLFIQRYQLYSDVYSAEQIAQNETYELEAEVMYEWMLIDEDQKGGLDDAATKELVTQVCVRFMDFREEGAAGEGSVQIKDLKKCHDQQAIIDAVHMGMVTLDNGYFDAMEKLTYEQCNEIMASMDELERTLGLDAGELEVEYQDDVEILDAEYIADIQFEYAEEPQEGEEVGASDGAQVVPLGNSSMQITNLASTNASTIKITVFAAEYERNPARYGVGKVVLYDPNLLVPAKIPANLTDFRPFAGEVSSVKKDGLFYILTLKPREVSKVVKNSDGINKTSTSNSKPIADQSVLTEADEGFNLKKTESGTGIVATFKHTFTVTDKIYTGSSWENWANPEAKPSVTVIAVVDNFSVTTKNLGKLILGSNTEGTVRVNFDTTVRVIAQSGGLRYSPANNGNGGAIANFKNSRWTGASAGGSKMIKLGKADVPIGTTGFCVTCWFYMYVQMDGSITIKAEMDNSYKLSMKKTWYGTKTVSVTNNSSKPSLTEMEVNANLSAGLQVEPGLYFWGNCLLDAKIKAGFTLNAKATLYKEGEAEAQQKNVYATQADLDDLPEYHYCINTSISFDLEGHLLTTKSVIGKIIKKKYKKDSIKAIDKSWELVSVHFEDGTYMSSCSRTNEGAVEVNSDGEIYLDTYKVVLPAEGCADVAITSVPMNDKKINNAEGFTVSSADKSVATVKFDENTKILTVTAVGSGSTEITIKIKKSKNSKKYYSQTLSVTVNAGKVTESAVIPGEIWQDGENSIILCDMRHWVNC